MHLPCSENLLEAHTLMKDEGKIENIMTNKKKIIKLLLPMEV